MNNAGADILTGHGASLSTVEKLDLLLAVDLRGTVLASWQAAEILGAQETGGVIINMSWDHVLTGMPGLNPQLFAAVKGGVLAFSKSLARSVAPRVRVNVLAPGWIDTSFGTGLDEAARRAVAESTPLKRWGTPDDVAGGSGVPRLARGRIHHRSHACRWRRNSDVKAVLVRTVGVHGVAH